MSSMATHRRQVRGNTSSLLLLVVLVAAELVCTYTGADQNDDTPPGNPFVIDLDQNLKGQLSILYDNNIELTRRTLAMIDELPVNEDIRKANRVFALVHFPVGANVWVRNDSHRNNLEDLFQTNYNPYRLMLGLYLDDVRRFSPNTSTVTDSPQFCNSFRPDTILTCCRSPCQSCNSYEWIDSGSRLATLRTHLEAKLPAGLRGSLDEDFKWPTDHFCKQEMDEFLKTILELYPSDHGTDERTMSAVLREILKYFPDADPLGDKYYDNMLGLLASLGVPMRGQRFLTRPSSRRSEPGLVPLLARLSLLARTVDNKKRCRSLSYCFEGKCGVNEELEKEGYKCMKCETGARRGGPKMRPAFLEHASPYGALSAPEAEPSSEFSPQSADEANEVLESLQMDLVPYPSTTPTTPKEWLDPAPDSSPAPLIPSEKPYPGPRPIDPSESSPTTTPESIHPPDERRQELPDRLLIDYSKSLGLDTSDLTALESIETATVSCRQPDAPSCAFRKTCGLAPLNPLSTSEQRASSYVVNGENQIYGEFPSFVRLEIEWAGSFGFKARCGGTLVSDRHVLTAAHCVSRKRRLGGRETVKPSYVRLIFADHIPDQEDEFEIKVKGVKSVCVSRKYGPKTVHDWALITLREPVGFNDHIQPACLPLEPVLRTGEQSKCFLVGVGVTGHRADGGLLMGIAPKVVQKMRSERVSCRAWGISDLDRSRECYTKSGGQKGDSCSGDSGGPILCLNSDQRWTLVSSVSFGTENCNDEGKYAWISVNARLRTLIEDIKEQCDF